METLQNILITGIPSNMIDLESVIQRLMDLEVRYMDLQESYFQLIHAYETLKNEYDFVAEGTNDIYEAGHREGFLNALGFTDDVENDN